MNDSIIIIIIIMKIQLHSANNWPMSATFKLLEAAYHDVANTAVSATLMF